MPQQKNTSMYAQPPQLQYHSSLPTQNSSNSPTATTAIYNPTTATSAWSDYVRSTSTTPTNSPPMHANQNSTTNCDQNTRFIQQQPQPHMHLHDWSETSLTETLAANFSENPLVAELIYNDQYATTALASSIPLPADFSTASENFNFNPLAATTTTTTNTSVSPNVSASTTPMIPYGDIVMSEPDPQETINAPSPISSSSSSSSYSSSSSPNRNRTRIMIKNNPDSVNANFASQTTNGFDQLAAAAAVMAARDENHDLPCQKQEDKVLKREQKPLPKRKSRPQETSLCSLNANTQVSDSGRNNRRPQLSQLNIDNPQNYYPMTFSSDSLSNTSAVPAPVFFGSTFLDSVSNDFSTFDGVSSTGSMFTDQIMDNPTTVTPTAVSTVEQHFSPQPTFTQLLTQTPQTIDPSLDNDYFTTKSQEMSNDQSPISTKRRSSIPNTSNIKYEQMTPPTLSPPQTPPKELHSSPPSPASSSSSPCTPTYRRTSLPILEEDDETSLVISTTPRTVQDINMTSVSPISPVSVSNLQLTSQTNITIMRSVIQQYLSSPNPASLGEKAVMVLTSKVAQKSYGTEKRFLCPPPTTLIMGSNWWTPSPPTTDANGNCHPTATLNAPKITVGISGEQGHQPGIFEWISPTGSSLDPSSCSDMAFSGKCVSKHLYINDADEKRKRVEVLVKIQSPMGHNFGTFSSKPIKVISKPSKKRQSVKNMELCIHHGTTISLFNRIRSQTVSTKYLGVSMHNTNQSYVHWNGAGPEQASPCFVARTGSWDPFIIWIVDPNYNKNSKDDSPQQPPHPNYPRPPPSAIKALSSTPIPIHYNQPVVLQCLTTGMTSPVMVIRKVDKGSMVIGGGFLEAVSGLDSEEALGDPVSQLHKVAFQIKDHTPGVSANFASLDRSHPPGPGTYLACLGDVVGMQLAHEGRKSISPTTPSSVSNSFMGMMMASPMTPNTDLPPELAAPWGTSLHFNTEPSPMCETAIVQSEGGKVVRKRRVSTSVAVKPTTSLSKALKSRRRGNSLSGVASEVDLARIATDGRGLGNNLRHSSDSVGALWTEDVTDSAVWTIVGTDCATYTFYSPPAIITRQMDSASPANCRPLQHQYPPPPPSTPVTPIPTISNILTATSSTSSATTPASQLQQHSTTPNTITIYGEHFTRDLTVWFGDLPSRTDYRSRECLVCWLPDELILYSGGSNSKLNDVIGTASGRRDGNMVASYSRLHHHHHHHQNGTGMRPILLSRNDGVVFRTGKMWP